MDEDWGLFGSSDDDDEPGIKKSLSTNRAMVLREDLSCGGNRGFFAEENLEAGRLLLAEVPWITWPLGDLSTPANLWAAAAAVLENPAALEASTTLHPLSLDDAQEGEADAMRKEHGERMVALLDKGEPKSTESELVLLLLRLHHNGFASGLYTRLSIFNHSCDPNVIKFSTTSSTAGASECWTTKPVGAGEVLRARFCVLSFACFRPFLCA